MAADENPWVRWIPNRETASLPQVGRITTKAATVALATEIARTQAEKGFAPLPVTIRLIEAEPYAYAERQGHGTTAASLWECDFAIFGDTSRKPEDVKARPSDFIRVAAELHAEYRANPRTSDGFGMTYQAWLEQRLVAARLEGQRLAVRNAQEES